MTIKYLAKFQSPSARTRPKIIGPEQNVNSICNSSLYTYTQNMSAISEYRAKKVCDTVLFRNDRQG